MAKALVISAAAAALGALALLASTIAPRDDEPRDPDVVIVLGGSSERAALGIELASRFEVPLILSSSSAGHARRLGVRCGEHAQCFRPRPETTVGEARTVRDMTEHFGWERVLIATTDVHTSRARVLFRQCLGDRVDVVGAPRSGPSLRTVELAREAVALVWNLTFDRAC